MKHLRPWNPVDDEERFWGFHGFDDQIMLELGVAKRCHIAEDTLRSKVHQYRQVLVVG